MSKITLTKKETESFTNAVQFVTEKHLGQFDKGGAPYIDHVLRVAYSGKTFDEMMVGLFHDVLEDTNATGLELLEYLSKDQLSAVIALSKPNNVVYKDYILEITENELATKVKINDLYDNMDLRRLKVIREVDLKRYEKYSKVFSYLNMAVQNKSLIKTGKYIL